jgi:hypothetical protein
MTVVMLGPAGTNHDDALRRSLPARPGNVDSLYERE